MIPVGLTVQLPPNGLASQLPQCICCNPLGTLGVVISNLMGSIDGCLIQHSVPFAALAQRPN